MLDRTILMREFKNVGRGLIKLGHTRTGSVAKFERPFSNRLAFLHQNLVVSAFIDFQNG